ncbi:MAG: hypothetical protein ACK4HV_05525, partial [Parachlamydiaceae bacterium]
MQSIAPIDFNRTVSGMDSNESQEKLKAMLNLSYSHSKHIQEYAKNLFHLEEIDLSHSSIEDRHILQAIPDFSRNNPKLKKLNLKGASFEAKTIIGLLHAFPHLESINLFGCKGVNNHDVAAAIIQLMKEKKTLTCIKGLFIDKPEDLFECAKNAKGLEKLSIVYQGLKWGSFEDFIRMLAENSPGLRQFHFYDRLRVFNLPKPLFDQFPSFWRELEDLHMELPCGADSKERHDLYLKFKKITVLRDAGLKMEEAVSLISHFSKQLEKILFTRFQPKMAFNAFFLALSSCPNLRKLDIGKVSLAEFEALPIPSSILSRLEYLKLNWDSLKARHWYRLSRTFGNERVKKLHIDLTGNLFAPQWILISIVEISKRCLNLESLSLKMLQYRSSAWDFRDVNVDKLRHYHLNGALDSRVKIYGEIDRFNIEEF